MKEIDLVQPTEALVGVLVYRRQVFAYGFAPQAESESIDLIFMKKVSSAVFRKSRVRSKKGVAPAIDCRCPEDKKFRIRFVRDERQ